MKQKITYLESNTNCPYLYSVQKHPTKKGWQVLLATYCPKNILDWDSYQWLPIKDFRTKSEARYFWSLLIWEDKLPRIPIEVFAGMSLSPVQII